jgi:uncharacterized protein YdaU (DUF1376 family)
MLQHGAYTLLIDACYDREVFPTLEQAIDWTWASTEAEIDSVKFVLSRFFKLSSDGQYVQDRILEELLQYHKNADTNKRIAIERETKRKDKSTNREQIVDEPPPNQEPLTKNQEPINTLVAIATQDCQHQKILDAYHEILPELPQVKILTEKRKTLLKARWREDEKRQDIEFWNRFFGYVRTSDFLMGKSGGFQANFEWLINSTNFVKVIEGNYENR